MQLLERAVLPWRLGAAAVFGLAAIATARAVPARAEVPAPTIAIAAPAPVVAVTAVTTVEPPPTHSLQLRFLFQLEGATYMKLADLERDALPRHGRVRVVSDDGISAAIASVTDRDGWVGREVIVDGRCHATITKIAVVARLTGAPAYAGIDQESWTAATLIEHGDLVLAAKLDRCTGVYARDADLAPVVVPEQVSDPAAEHAAKAIALASAVAAKTQHNWSEAAHRGHWFDEAQWTIQTLRHPRTGTTWVAVHAHQDWGCGDPEVNLWGLFRVEPDGTLTTLALREHELAAIEQLVDVDDDGELEVIGKPWLGLDRVLEHASGDVVEQLSLPFFGCPC